MMQGGRNKNRNQKTDEVAQNRKIDVTCGMMSESFGAFLVLSPVLLCFFGFLWGTATVGWIRN